ncbi:hypothetical protein AB8Z38_06775 [Bradyrhizobium sp. LLZ17]|uniref:Ribbon-helix-helix domain-containing protein n=1 Tax=Bradyrhizobium sp. LLZ17 TaxID=3239388 RepID=A0AB39XPH0_9BRAD
MPDVGFRYDRPDLLRAVAERRGVGLSTLLRSLADAAVASEGFPVGRPVQQTYRMDLEKLLELHQHGAIDWMLSNGMSIILSRRYERVDA